MEHRLVFAIHKSWENGFGEFLDSHAFNPRWEGDAWKGILNIDLFEIFEKYSFDLNIPKSIVWIIGEYVAGTPVYSVMTFRGKIQMASFEAKKLGKGIPFLKKKWKEKYGDGNDILQIKLDRLKERCAFVARKPNGEVSSTRNDFLLPQFFRF